MNRLIAPIAAALALTGAAAQAAEPLVSVKDLDLGTSKGQRIANSRISQAADLACGTLMHPRPIVLTQSVKACRTAFTQEARTALSLNAMQVASR